LDLKKISLNSLWLCGERIIKLLSTFFISIFMARSLGEEDFGKYSYVMTYVMIFVPIGLLGLENIMIKNLVEKNFDKKILSVSFAMQLVSFFAIFLLLLLTTRFFVEDSELVKYILILFLGFLFNPLTVVKYYYNAKLKSFYYSIVSITNTLIFLSMKIFSIYLSKDIFYIIIIKFK